MDNNTVINMISEAMEELLYSQEWKDLEGKFTRIPDITKPRKFFV